jgi:hypothetical protein
VKFRRTVIDATRVGVYAFDATSVAVFNSIIKKSEYMAIGGEDASKIIVTNSTIYDNGRRLEDDNYSRAGVGLWGSSQALLVNNTITHQRNPLGGGVGVYADDNSRAELRYNLLFQNLDGYLVEEGQGRIVETNTLRTAPLFINSQAGDYHLSGDPPCVYAGDPAIQDADGSRSDIGAYGGEDGGW